MISIVINASSDLKFWNLTFHDFRQSNDLRLDASFNNCCTLISILSLESSFLELVYKDE